MAAASGACSAPVGPDQGEPASAAAAAPPAFTPPCRPAAIPAEPTAAAAEPTSIAAEPTSATAEPTSTVAEAPSAAPEPTSAAAVAPQAFTLLKFEGPHDMPLLCDEGLAALECLPGPVCPIAFVGDGRSGKSYLASKMIGEGTFKTDDTDVAVTHGIDVAVRASHPGHVVVFDCEGGNNAMSKSHSIVTVIGALMATSLVFVTDGKASEAAIEALGMMLQERSLIKCDGTGSIHAQTLLFVVNQVRLRYSDDALERILSVKKDEESTDLREQISQAYPEGKRAFHSIPTEGRPDFDAKLDALQEAIKEAATPLQMGRLWMSGKQMVDMLRRIELELRTRGKVSLPSLHRHVILDSWLKPTVSQVLASGMKSLVENSAKQEWAQQQTGTVVDDCAECKKPQVSGWLDPDIEEFFCTDCWRTFSPEVLKCGFCHIFQPWPLGRVEKVTRFWHCLDCLMQLGIDIEE